MSTLLGFFIFGFGAIVGSFLNVVLWRLRTGESIVVGRSHCPSCRHVLAAVDLVPIASWLALRGRCRYCRTPIDSSYLAVELATGALFALAAWRVLPAASFDGRTLASLLLDWFVLGTLIVVFVYDLRYMLIPRRLTLPAAAIAFAANAALGRSATGLLAGIAIGAGFFWLQYAISRGRWIGGGDIGLGALIGAALGAQGTLLTLFLAYVVGAIVGVALLASRAKSWRSEVPFGTFLSAAAAVALLFGDPIVDWYLHLL